MDFEFEFGDSAKRPRVALPWGLTDKIAIAVCALAVLALWLWPTLVWHGLPERFAVHFALDGTPNGWGGRGTLLIAPIITTALDALLLLLARAPHLYNYTVRITEENAPREYRVGRSLMLWLAAELSALFLFAEGVMIAAARDAHAAAAIAYLPILLLVLFATLGWHIYRMVKAK